MKPMDTATYKRVGANGQISIGKEWAGKLVRVIETENAIEIMPGEFIPESQRTFFTKKAQGEFAAFNAFEAKNSPKKTDLKALKKNLGVKK